jgi:hypothetical protein
MSSQNNNNLYNSKEARLDTIVGGQTWWPKLYLAKIECPLPDEEFPAWLETTYGVRIIYDEQGQITEHYEVIDEGLYLIFNLKFA